MPARVPRKDPRFSYDPWTPEERARQKTGKDTARQRVSDAQNLLLTGAFQELCEAKQNRYREDRTQPWLNVLRSWCRCKWHKEMGYSSFRQLAASMWTGTEDYWAGWEVLALGIVPPNRWLFKLLWGNRLGLEKLGMLRTVLTQENWRGWVTLGIHLNRRELASTVISWRKASKTGYYKAQDLIFVPLWVPQGEYKEVLDGKDGPPWEAIKAHYEKTGDKG